MEEILLDWKIFFSILNHQETSNHTCEFLHMSSVKHSLIDGKKKINYNNK